MKKFEKEKGGNKKESAKMYYSSPSINQSKYINLNESNLNVSNMTEMNNLKGLNLNDKKSVKEFALKIMTDSKRLKSFQAKVYETSKQYDTLNKSIEIV